MRASRVALENPTDYPDAALSRLLETSAKLRTASLRGEGYAALLSQSADLSERSVSLLVSLLAGTATEGQSAGVINAERTARACWVLFRELARTRSRRSQIDAMSWARLHRDWYSDVALVRREFAPLAMLGLNTLVAQPVASIRILPGAEPALRILSQDPPLALDFQQLASDLVEWVA